jgi:hypothetical protein
MIRKIIICCVALAASTLLMGVAGAYEGWQLRLSVGVSGATNVLVIGQASGALDGVDPVNDVPAMLSGDVQAYTELEGDSFWQDIMAPCGNGACSKKWIIFVSSALDGETVGISWDPETIPQGLSLVLTDSSNHTETDMTGSSSYSYVNDGARGFTIEAHGN